MPRQSLPTPLPSGKTTPHTSRDSSQSLDVAAVSPVAAVPPDNPIEAPGHLGASSSGSDLLTCGLEAIQALGEQVAAPAGPAGEHAGLNETGESS